MFGEQGQLKGNIQSAVVASGMCALKVWGKEKKPDENRVGRVFLG